MEKRFLDTCKVLFAAGDEDNNGFLDRSEFVAVLKSKALNLNLTQKEIEQVVNDADSDNNGEITLDEFIPIVKDIFYRNKQKGLGNLSEQRKRATRAQDAKYGDADARAPLPHKLSPDATKHEPQKQANEPGGARANSDTHDTVPSTDGKANQDAKATGWGLIRKQLPSNCLVSLPRIAAAPIHDRLDFATIACVAARANKSVTELDVLRIRRLGLDAIKSVQLKHAEEYLSCAVSLAERLPPRTGMLQLSLSLNSLGELYLQTHRLPRARDVYARALEVRKSMGGPRSMQVLECTMLLSVICARMKDAGSAIAHGKEALPLLERRGSAHVRSKNGLHAHLQATFLQDLTKALEDQGDVELALDVQKRGIAMLSRQFMRGTRDVRNILLSLGLISDVLEGQVGADIEKSCQEHAMQELMSKRSADTGDHSEEMIHANTMYSLARMLLQQGEHEEAQSLIEQVLVLFEKIHGPLHLRVAYGLVTLASCFSVQKGQERKAFPNLERAVKIIESHYGPQCLQLAEPGGPLVLLAQIQELVGYYSTSFKTLKRIADIREKYLPPSHPSITDIVAEIQRLKDSMKSPERRHSFSSLQALIHEREDRSLCSICRLKMDPPATTVGFTVAHLLPEAQAAAPAVDIAPAPFLASAKSPPLFPRNLCGACKTVAQATRLDRMGVTWARSKANVAKWRREISIARLHLPPSP